MTLRLRFACDVYDLLEPIIRGEVTVEGAELETIVMDSRRHDLMAREGSFDLCEFSMCSYLVARDRGLPLVAIPVFPRRMFVERYLFVRGDSILRSPADLAGRRVGIHRWQNTLAFWTRAWLRDHAGVDPDGVRWVIAKPEAVEGGSRPGLHRERAPDGVSLGALLEAGAIDALAAPDIPRAFLDGSGRIRRLLPDFRAAEQEGFRRTGVFPIMHVVVMRADLAEREPELAARLVRAFSEARRRAVERFSAHPTRISIPWFWAQLEEDRRIAGDDPWPYRASANRATLETMLRHALEDRLVSRRLALEELFAAGSEEVEDPQTVPTLAAAVRAS